MEFFMSTERKRREFWHSFTMPETRASGPSINTLLVLLSIVTVFTAKADVSFEKDILPLFQKSCSACHFPPTEPLKGKLDLSTVAATLKGGADGAIVVPGKADESRLVQIVEGKLETVMPPKGKGDPLTPEAIALLKQWINEGAKGDATTPAPRSSVSTDVPTGTRGRCRCSVSGRSG